MRATTLRKQGEMVMMASRVQRCEGVDVRLACGATTMWKARTEDGAAREFARCRRQGRRSAAGLTLMAAAEAPVRERVRERVAGVEVDIYRKYTEGMVRRYGALSLEVGRVPSLLGREMFRGNVTSYRVKSFEDVVIFCHDVENCLKRLNETERQLLKRITLQEYTHSETACMLGLSVRSCVRQYAAAVDRLTGIFLRDGMLEELTGVGYASGTRAPRGACRRTG